MPKAKRRTALSTASSPSGLVDGVIVLPASELRLAAGRWNKIVNWVSGTIVLSYGKTGMKRADMAKSISLLRQCADEMEKFL